MRVRCWGGDYVVFNPFSGQTHYLDIVTGRVLEHVMARALSISEVRREIAAFLEVENNDEVAKMAAKILLELESVGLVEPID